MNNLSVVVQAVRCWFLSKRAFPTLKCVDFCLETQLILAQRMGSLTPDPLGQSSQQHCMTHWPRLMLSPPPRPQLFPHLQTCVFFGPFCSCWLHVSTFLCYWFSQLRVMVYTHPNKDKKVLTYRRAPRPAPECPGHIRCFFFLQSQRGKRVWKDVNEQEVPSSPWAMPSHAKTLYQVEPQEIAVGEFGSYRKSNFM